MFWFWVALALLSLIWARSIGRKPNPSDFLRSVAYLTLLGALLGAAVTGAKAVQHRTDQGMAASVDRQLADAGYVVQGHTVAKADGTWVAQVTPTKLSGCATQVIVRPDEAGGISVQADIFSLSAIRC